MFAGQKDDWYGRNVARERVVSDELGEVGRVPIV